LSGIFVKEKKERRVASFEGAAVLCAKKKQGRLQTTDTLEKEKAGYPSSEGEHNRRRFPKNSFL